MPNFVVTKSTCRKIVAAGTVERRNAKRIGRAGRVPEPDKKIIQVEIVMTGEATSLNPTWHKQDGWDKRRWAYARVLDEDGE